MRPIDGGWDSNTVIGIWEYLDNGPLHSCLRDLNLILPIIMTTNTDMVLPVNLNNNNQILISMELIDTYMALYELPELSW